MDSSRAEVEALLPHRDPFLFVDRLVERGDGALSTEWAVPEDLDVFRGHYPGNPILPGVLIAEHCFQSGALLIYTGAASKGDAGTPVLTRIEDARYKRLVRPGDVLATTVTLEDSLANARFCAAVVRCEGQVVARLKFTLALAAEAPA
ncbi:MAG: beta-hydroxyacyl-ACP dehydratase [Planctomycetota bacterium]|nr:beta-hydroxyacyl-ACP dehydratase [Planctomycetota bacterium]